MINDNTNQGEGTSHVLIITFRNACFEEEKEYRLGPRMNLVKTADVPKHVIEFALASENTVTFRDNPRRRVYDWFRKEDEPSAKWLYEFAIYVETEGIYDSDVSDDPSSVYHMAKPTCNIRKYEGYTDPDVKITHVIVVNCQYE